MLRESLTQEDMIDMLMNDPITIFSVMVSYWDGVKKLYTFSSPDSQEDWIVYLTENQDKEGVKEMVVFDSLLDMTDTDIKYFLEVH